MTWVYIGPKDEEREKDKIEKLFFSQIFSNKTERLRKGIFLFFRISVLGQEKKHIDLFIIIILDCF